MGTPDDYILRVLAKDISRGSWKDLGRQLGIKEPQLDAFDEQNHQCREKAYKMLLSWKENNGSGASYRVLHDALCHDLVGSKILAEEFCCED